MRSDRDVGWAEQLRSFRERQRISQLELALRLGISQRHVSFVENGRSHPSRELLVFWLQALATPLSERNRLLMAAGYAPAFSNHRLTDPAMQSVRAALSQLLSSRDPQPALVLDSHWNVLQLNRAAAWLVTALQPPGASIRSHGDGHQRFNLLDWMVEEQGLVDRVTNLEQVGPQFLHRLRQESLVVPDLGPKADAFEAVLCSKLGVRWPIVLPGSDVPTLCTRYDTPWGELSFFSLFTTFGSPQDITLASLRVEHLFASDAHTRVTLDRAVADFDCAVADGYGHPGNENGAMRE